jgi:hypothetical protein
MGEREAVADLGGAGGGEEVTVLSAAVVEGYTVQGLLVAFLEPAGRGWEAVREA